MEQLWNATRAEALRVFDSAVANPQHLLHQSLWWNGVMTLAFYSAAFVLQNCSLYDPYWSMAPMVVAAFFAKDSLVLGALSARQWALLCIVFAWGLRLTLSWWRRLGKEIAEHGKLVHEDWRYGMIRDTLGGNSVVYWVVGALLAIHVFPTLLVYLGCLPLWYALATDGAAAWTALDTAGLVVGVVAVYLETRADLEMDRFLARDGDRRNVCRTGLWAVSRHPNYAGEMLFWVSVLLFGLGAAGTRALWTSIGLVAMVALFAFGSIPMMETRQRERRGAAFAQYAAEVPCVIPRNPLHFLPFCLPAASSDKPKPE